MMRRRSFGAGAAGGLLAVAGVYLALPRITGEPSAIVTMARRIKTIIDREDYLDSLPNRSEEQDAEEARIYDERCELAEKIVASPATNVTEALLVIMHGVDRVNYGQVFEDCEDVVERGERAIRGAMAVLIREMGIDLIPLGSSHFLPDYLCLHYKENA